MQKSSLVKNVIFKIILNVFNIIIPLLIGPYVYRTLGADSIGKVQFSETIFNYFFIFAVFGVYQYGLREMSRIKGNQQKVNQLFTSLLTISIVTSVSSLLVYFVVIYLGYGDNAIFPILLLYSINLIGNIFYVEWVNEANEKYDFITIKTVIIKGLYVVLLFALVKTPDNYMEYASLLILTTVLNNIVSFVYIKRKIKLDFSHITLKKHIRPLFLVVIFSNANILYNQLDRFMLGEFLGEAKVSFYVMAQQMMGIVNTLMLSIIQVTIPRLSYLSGSEDEESYLYLLNNISRIYFAFLFPASIGLFIISDFGVLLYGGAAFVDASPVLKVFSIYMIFLGIESILSNQIIYVKQKENILVRLVFVAGFINVVLNSLLVLFNVFSPTTAIFTTTIANVLLITFEYIYIRKQLKVDYKLFEISKLKYLFYALIFLPISYVIDLFTSGMLLTFILDISINIVVYFGILYFTKDFVLALFLDKIKAKLRRKA
ncbi:oligosaccharide flippase family protein [Fredinandcohnia sp. 179-A 10B2 NHS]|uniref:oligosaccharide flippase family protein n=1 Tax=Fredinandcohnia sp. 179-A 10B2 NHS TaxID=3235176 RepID=UPI00399EFFEA